MLLEDKTKEEFGYVSSELSKMSRKKVYVKCDYCGHILTKTMKQITVGREVITKDSCKKCRFKKRKEVSLAKYGVKNSAQRDDVKKKLSTVDISQYHDQIVEMADKHGYMYIADKLGIPGTSLHRYMKKHNIVSECSIQQKRENTFKDKTGQDYRDWKKKDLTRVSQEKYGVDNPFMAEEVKQKSKQTMLEKYGVEHPMQSSELVSRSLKTVREKYGTDNVAQNHEVKEKIKQTNLSRYGVENPMQNKDVVQKMIDTRIEQGDIYVYQGKRMSELADDLGRPYSTLVMQIRTYGPEKALKMKNKNKSMLEQIMESYLKDIGVNYICQFRVENRIADFFLPDHNLIIECDGLYWHSEAVIKDKYYHKNKLELYNKHRYRALFFREDEIRDKFHIVKSIICNAIGQNERRIYARRCTAEELMSDDAAQFMEAYHLMGKGSGRTFALIYKDEIVSALRIRKSHKPNFHEISRYCCVPHTTIVGGFSKLLKFAHNTMFFPAILTFIDRRYGVGDYLPKLGFNMMGDSPSFKWTDGEKSFHRMSFPGNSGYSKGMVKLWDCGQARFEMVYNQ